MSAIEIVPEPTVRCSLLDVDLPFLKVLPSMEMDASEQCLEVGVDGEFFDLQATRVRAEPDGAYWMRILNDEVSGAALERSFLVHRATLATEDRRYADRIRTTFRVTSPDLPEHRGTTYDVSSTGLRLVTEQPVEVGTKLNLFVQESESLVPVVVLGEAVWTASRDDTKHHVGVRFLKNMHN